MTEQRLLWDLTRRVPYVFKQSEGCKSFREFRYQWRHNPTGKSGTTRIWCRCKEHLHLLIQQWNYTESWWYRVVA